MHFAFPPDAVVFGVSADHVYFGLQKWICRMELETLKVQRLYEGYDVLFGMRSFANGDAMVSTLCRELHFASDGTRLSGARSGEFAKWEATYDYTIRRSGNQYVLHKETGRTRERLRYLVRDDAMRRRLETFL